MTMNRKILFPDYGVFLSKIVLFVAVVASATVDGGPPNRPWHIGCYQLSSDYIQTSVNISDLGTAGGPSFCGQQCLDKRFNFVAINSSRCLCLGISPADELKLPAELCNLTCDYNASALLTGNDGSPLAQQLPCGGAGSAFSLYRSAGPYLYSLALSVAGRAVYAGQEFVISVVVCFASFPDVELGFDASVPVAPSSVYVQLFCDDTSGVGQFQTFSVVGKTGVWNVVCMVNDPGNYSAYATVANVFSNLSFEMPFIVFSPLISSLDILLLADQNRLPSCSLDSKSSNVSQQMVFEGIPVLFEASVNVWFQNVVFTWTFSDADGNPVFSVEEEGTPCLDGQSCTISIQEYSFLSGGSYSVSVMASNNISHALSQMYLMVVSPGLANVTIGVASPIGLTGEEIGFMISIGTVALQSTTFFIEFGDGHVKNLVFYSSDQHNPRKATASSTALENSTEVTPTENFTQIAPTFTLAVTEPDWEGLEMMATYSYSQDCHLSFVLEHMYSDEGSYRPTLSVSDGFSNVSLSLADSLIIANKLELISVNHSRISAVNRSVTFTATTDVSSLVVFHWQIFLGDLLVFEVVRNDFTMIHTFLEDGDYKILVNASNPAGSVAATSGIRIEVPVTNLKVSCGTGDRNFVAIHQGLNCSAKVDGGSNIDYRWNFSDNFNPYIKVWNEDLSSRTQHRFHSVGEYEVSVEASNSFNRMFAVLPYKIVVTEPLSSVWVLHPKPALLGNPVTFVVCAFGKSEFLLHVKFGDFTDHVVLNATVETNITFSHLYSDVGSFRVRVSARNEVSHIRRSFDVDIQDSISEFNITIIGPDPFVGEPTMFAVYLSGELSNRTDLVYNWSIDGQVFAVTQSPIRGYLFDDVATYNVSVCVYNLVDMRSHWILINVTDANSQDLHVSLDQDVVATDSPSVLTLTNVPSGKLIIDHGDGAVDVVLSTGLNQSESLVHQYSEVGSYIISVQYFSNITSEMQPDAVVRTAVSVQERIADLTLRGPEILPVSRFAEPRGWAAVSSNGTNILYEWKLDGVNLTVTTKNKIYVAPSLGEHLLSVTASNGLDVLSANLSMLVQSPVVSVVVVAPDVTVGCRSRIRITVVSDGDFDFTCHFGDGVVIANASILFVAVDPIESYDEELQRYTVTLEHKYSLPGVYLIVVNVTNRISWLLGNATARVHEPIGGIALNSDLPLVLQTGSLVTVTAVASADYALVFNWTLEKEVCASSSQFDGVSWRSVGNCSLLLTPGAQVVTVNVSSAVASTWKVANMTFTALEPVSDLQLLTPGNPTETAVLKQNVSFPGNFYSDPVKFEARLAKGSNVSCIFDFGDNSSVQIVSCESIEFSPQSICRTTHIFHKAGTFEVNVTALNRISILWSSVTFFAQVELSGLHLGKDPEPYRTQVGLDVLFVTTLLSGTDVSYSWTMGDGRAYSAAGPNVTHRFSSLGCFRVNVEAFNRVNRLSASGRVFVQDYLRSVELLVDLPLTAAGAITQINVPVNFTAIPHPNVPCMVDLFEWRPIQSKGNPKNISYPSLSQRFSYVYQKLGTYTVTVTARNALSVVTSSQLFVTIMDVINAVEIQADSNTVVNFPLEFNAYHYTGNFITYSWNFGDNTTATSTDSRVRHVFRRAGVYTVYVNASNAISQQTAKQTIFVTPMFCRPPMILLLGPQDNVFVKSQEIRVEARIDINCSLTNLTKFEWNVTNVVTGENINLNQRVALHDPVLLLSNHSLAYGNYSVQLRVSMANTIVYGDAKTNYRFAVAPSPLQAVIYGGLTRNVSYHDDVILDASESRDPDDFDNANMTYSWSCSDFRFREKPCFSDPQTLSNFSNFTGVRMVIPRGKFWPDVTEFLVELNISKPNRLNSSAQQLLIFQQRPAIDVTIFCDDCSDLIVNPDDELAFHAVHFGYDEKELEYTWTVLEFFTKGSPAVAQKPPLPSSCFTRDGRDGILSQRSNNDSAVENPPRNSTVEPEFETGHPVYDDNAVENTPFEFLSPSPGGASGLTVLDRHLQQATWSTLGAESGQTPDNGRSVGTVARPSTVPAPVWLAPEETNGGSRNNRYRQLALPGGGSSGDRLNPPVQSTPAIFSPTSSTVPPWFPGLNQRLGEGNSDGKGYRDLAPGGRGSPSRAHPGQKQRGSDDNGPDAAIDHSLMQRDRGEIFTADRRELTLLPQDTMTGVNDRILVIKPNVLTPGIQYTVQVSVRHHRGNRTGTSTTMFRVNESPDSGHCSLNAAASSGGVEMLSEFSVYCHTWKDEDYPLLYGASYRFAQNSSSRLIYRGLDHHIKFRLPAGDPAFNYSVYLEVSVIDGLGARRSACVSLIPVQPQVVNESALLSQVGEDGTLSAYIQQGNNQRARMEALGIARQLNRVPPINSTRRQTIRSNVLYYLNIGKLPMRDMYEVQQSVSILAEVTSVVEEIVEESATNASYLLTQLGRTLHQLPTAAIRDDPGSVELAVGSTSDVIDWLVRGTQSTNSNEMKRHLTQCMALMEAFLQVKAKLLYPDRDQAKQSTSSLSTLTARFSLDSNPQIAVDAVRLNFSFLQKGAMRLLPPLSAEPMSSCVESNVVVYKDNPYTFIIPSYETAIVTNVVSVTMYTCDGSKLNVSNLAEDRTLNISLPNSQTENVSKLYYLDRQFMNVHVFNLTSSDWLKDNLHIELNFNVIPQSARFFPITVFLQTHSKPSPDNFLYKWDVLSPKNPASFVINLAELNFAGDRSFAICIVEQTFNSIRPRPDQVKNLTYALTIWWGECLYWDTSVDDWMPTGCYVDNSSLFGNINCRCNHLTSFGASAYIYATDFKQYDVNQFFSLPLNPVTCAFLITVLIVFVILLFVATKLDSHDVKKLPVVSLVDNSPKDRQKYYMTLETGFRKGAGTTAKVSMVLHGEYGMTETRELISQTGQPLFERNSRDTFYMTFPESLGSIFKVQLWHDNSGSSPSWYLSRVTVKDACTGDVYYFVCEKWFAVEKEDGKVEREIMAADRGLSFSKILSAKSMQYLTDYHLWFSTLVKPSYSRFTRAQRLACCLCLLMSYMALSSGWYQYIGPPYRGEFSLIDISWSSIVTGMIISIVVLPPTLLIMLIFRRSKVYRLRFDETSEEFEKREAGLLDGSVSTEDQLLGGVTGLSVFEQTVMSWQNLQEWAQKTWAKRYQQSPVGSVQNVKPIPIRNADEETSPAVDNRVPVGTHVVSTDQYCNGVGCGTGTMQRSQGLLMTSMEPVRQTSIDSMMSQSSVEPVESVTNPEACQEWEAERCTSAVDPRDLAQSGVLERHHDAPEPFNRRDACRMNFRKRALGRSTNTSPSSSYFEPSPKEVRRIVLKGGSSEGCVARSSPPAPLQPPSYGIINQSGETDGSSCLRTNSNRSSVKSASSGHAKNTSFKKLRLFLPYYFVYVGWLLCFLLVVGCATITIYYGHRFSAAQSILWLQSIFFSFLQCIFISHPVIVVGLMLYSAVRYRNNMTIFDHYNDGLIHDSTVLERKEPKEDLSVDQKPVTLEEGISARQRSRYLRFARPPQEQRLIQARHQTMKETNASALVNETVLFVGQFLLLVFIAFGKDTGTTIELKQSLTKSFVSNGELAFQNVTSVSNWWRWVNGHFLDTVYNSGGIVDNCYKIGPVSLRQLRIKDIECDIDSLEKSNIRCRDLYDRAPHDTNSFVKNGTTYRYTSEENASSVGCDGQFSSYGGGGYIIFLGTDSREEDEKQLHLLENSSWIDHYTSVVFLQFTLFHPQSNLFATVSLVMELPPLGVTFTSSYIAIVYLYKYITAMDNLVLACELLFFLATMLKIHHEIIQVLHHGINYLKNVWNILEVSQCLLSLALIICYTYRFLLIDSLVERFRSTYHEEFVDVSNLAYWDQVLRSLTGFVLLLINLQLVKGLRHHQPFARFANVYNHTSLDFVVFACMFLIWLGAYVSLGIALFGGVMWEMTSVSQAIGYMTGLLESSYEFPQFKGLSSSELAIWEVYTMSFMILAYGTNAGYLLAFLTFHYKVFKDEPVLVFSPRESISYYCHKVLAFFTGNSSDAYNSEKQQETNMPPEFTMAEIQYQVDEMLFKMNALAGTSNLPEKPTMYFTDSDTTCIGVGEELSSNAGSSGEGNLENLLHRMKENLFRNDPHFAQLVNCDSSATRQDSNKQLMLQLEMEILQQLQSSQYSSNHLNELGTSAGHRREAAAGALLSCKCNRSTSCSDSATSSAAPYEQDSVVRLPEVSRNHALDKTMTSSFIASESSQRSGASREFDSACSPNRRKKTKPSGLELLVLKHLSDRDNEVNQDDADCLLDSGSVMETEFGKDAIRQRLVPSKDQKQEPVKPKKLGKSSSWVSSSTRSSSSQSSECHPSPTTTRSDRNHAACDVFPSVQFPSPQTTHRPSHTSEIVDDVFRLVEEDAFGVENEGYAVESSGEESDAV